MQDHRDQTSERDVFTKLLEGNDRFRRSNKDFQKLADSQDPDFVVVSCSDSRVSPAIIMDLPLGSVFEIRVAGAVFDESSIASVEFALENLKVSGVLVVGHTKCGAVSEAHRMFSTKSKEVNEGSGSHLENAVNSIFEIISQEDRNREDLTNAIIANTRAQLKKLLESNIVRKKSGSGGVAFAAALYTIEEGKLELI